MCVGVGVGVCGCVCVCGCVWVCVGVCVGVNDHIPLAPDVSVGCLKDGERDIDVTEDGAVPVDGKSVRLRDGKSVRLRDGKSVRLRDGKSVRLRDGTSVEETVKIRVIDDC